MFSLIFKKHLLRRTPAHSCTPMIPNMKKTKKHKRRTLPNIGKVSNNNVTKIRIPEMTNGTVVKLLNHVYCAINVK